MNIKEATKKDLTRAVKGEASASPETENKDDKSKESETVKVEQTPSVINIRKWRSSLRKSVSAASAHPKEALQWILEVEETKNWQELSECPARFERLDVKLLNAPWKVIQGALKQKLQVLDEQLMTQRRVMITGRQVLWFIYDHFRLHDGEVVSLEIKDLFAVKLNGDNINITYLQY